MKETELCGKQMRRNCPEGEKMPGRAPRKMGAEPQGYTKLELQKSGQISVPIDRRHGGHGNRTGRLLGGMAFKYKRRGVSAKCKSELLKNLGNLQMKCSGLIASSFID